MTPTTLLAVDPGGREFGYAVFADEALVDQGVKSLRRTRSKQDRLQVSQRTFTQLITEHQPQVVAIEQTSSKDTHRNDLLLVATERMRAIAHGYQLPIYEFALNVIKEIVTGDAQATKRTVAQAVCANYPYLRVHLGRKQPWQEWYAFRMFDAVACGLAYLAIARSNQLQQYAKRG